eukprot:355126-Chlamydomonas_euryale.AAC.6
MCPPNTPLCGRPPRMRRRGPSWEVEEEPALIERVGAGAGIGAEAAASARLRHPRHARPSSRPCSSEPHAEAHGSAGRAACRAAGRGACRGAGAEGRGWRGAYVPAAGDAPH